MARIMEPIISVVGRTNSGKTTFIERLIMELKKRGYRVAVIKHGVHDFEIDHEGKDTWRHTHAGADVVVIASSLKMAMIKKMAGERSLEEISGWLLPDMDIIITEGYKRADRPKIEVIRREVSAEPLCSSEELMAVVSDTPVALDVPRYGSGDASGAADLIEREFRLTRTCPALIPSGREERHSR